MEARELRPIATTPKRSSNDSTPGPYSALQGVGRAMEILATIAADPMRASDIVQRLGLKWTTAHRSLTYLLENRYLRRDEPSGVYSIGPGLYSLGQAYLIGHPLLDVGTISLRALAHETGGTAQLNERDGFESSVLMAVDERLELIPKTGQEYHFPLHAGSKGQVLLAFADPSVFRQMTIKPLVALTDKTITDPDVLYQSLAAIRQQGYAITREDIQVGTGSVATPILNQVGEIIGAICVIKKASEINDETEGSLTAAVTVAARDISLRLGWRHGVPVASQAAWDAEPRPSTSKRKRPGGS